MFSAPAQLPRRSGPNGEVEYVIACGPVIGIVSGTKGMNTKTSVYFVVFDFRDDPNVGSVMMEMKPTKAWVKGQHYGLGRQL